MQKGQSATIKGRVGGLAMNILVEDCEILLQLARGAPSSVAP